MLHSRQFKGQSSHTSVINVLYCLGGQEMSLVHICKGGKIIRSSLQTEHRLEFPGLQVLHPCILQGIILNGLLVVLYPNCMMLLALGSLLSKTHYF